MQTDSVELGFLSIFALITFFIFLITSKYSHKLNDGILLDKDFLKPQAFHNEAISRSGGIAALLSLFIFLSIYYLLFSEILYQYIFVCTSLFLVGYLDDIKKRVSSNIRLILMIIFLIIFINLLSIEIKNIDLIFLSSWLDNKIFSTIFVLLCFLFIVNGANLIDGFNGLLAINSLIINSVLLYINLNNNIFEFSIFLTAQIIILLCFLLFNFPRAKIFLGDSGSYLFGSLIALNIIFTNNLDTSLSAFFFCILLFYLFYEVFFSFFRKLLQKKSPLLPDQNHLHMLVYKYLEKNYPSRNNNHLTSLYLNIVYLILVSPGIYFMHNPLFNRCWFFVLLAFYTVFYLRLYKTIK
jgi:UDP-N-acetylmuramyl pentapeptide phosphotransferase/UDP-N-acetylglucosamine-1-phosphate transferase